MYGMADEGPSMFVTLEMVKKLILKGWIKTTNFNRFK